MDKKRVKRYLGIVVLFLIIISVGYALTPWPSWAASQKDFYLSPSRTTFGSTLTIAVAQWDVVYFEGYVWNSVKQDWEAFPLVNGNTRGSWTPTTVDHTITIDAARFTPGENYVVVWGCNRDRGKQDGWDCSDVIGSDDGRWMLATFFVAVPVIPMNYSNVPTVTVSVGGVLGTNITNVTANITTTTNVSVNNTLTVSTSTPINGTNVTAPVARTTVSPSGTTTASGTSAGGSSGGGGSSSSASSRTELPAPPSSTSRDSESRSFFPETNVVKDIVKSLFRQNVTEIIAPEKPAETQQPSSTTATKEKKRIRWWLGPLFVIIDAYRS